MSNLTLQTKSLNIVISLKLINFDQFKELLTKWCVSYCEQYAFILHDKDITGEGVAKIPHIHLVCYLFKRQRLKQCLYQISEQCHIDINAISIDKTSNIDASIQYLIHKGYPDKFQYDIKDIYTNIIYEDLIDILEDDIQTFDYDTVKNIARSCCCYQEYIKRVWKWYNRYWRILEKMWQWYGNDL